MRLYESENITGAIGDYLGAHYPYSFTFKRSGAYMEAEILRLEVPRIGYSSEYKLHGLYENIDISAVLQKCIMQYYKSFQGHGRLGIVPVKEEDIRLTLYKIERRLKVQVGEVIEATISIVDGSNEGLTSYTVNKRLSGEGVGKPYFKGYPQVDTYLVSKGNSYTGVNVERTRVSFTEGSMTFYPKGEITREIDECGTFLRWRTSYGSWGYWLFSMDVTKEIKTKSVGGFDSIALGIAERKHLGFTATESWKLTSHVPVLSNELEEVKDLYTSNEVYLFKGKRYTEGEGHWQEDFFLSRDWIRVQVKEGSVKFDEPEEVYNVNVEIEFPDKITRKIV